jgi:hypothetical protein
LRGRHNVLDHVVEAAAVDLPLVAFHTGGQSRARLQRKIEVDEIKRAADPRDTGNDMKPAEDSACGFGEYHVHEFPLLSSIAGKTQWQNGIWLRKLARPANQARFSPFAAFCSRRICRMMVPERRGNAFPHLERSLQVTPRESE